MKRVVFNVAAEHSGALTILKQYYDLAVNDKDKENHYTFVISTPSLLETDNVKVLRYPWVKTSWFHRLYFDRFVAPKIAEQVQADEVLSLQNLVVRGIKVKQTLYLHQPLPFVEKRYGITEDFMAWVYQNIMSRMIFDSVRKANSIIVQTQWMKEACVEKIKVSPSKINVIQPVVNITIKKSYKQENEANKLFFYPASAIAYKNHTIIIEAVKHLKQKGIDNFRVVLTLEGHENKAIEKMFQEAQTQALPIEFIGKIPLNEVYDYYSQSILIFPSYIETFGLPMLEAKLHGSPILASDCAFSHEILDGYNQAEFFDPFDIDALASSVERIVTKSRV